MADKNSERYLNTPDCKVPIRGRYKRNIIDLAKAFFRTRYRSTSLNRKDWRFDVHVVDAEPAEVKEFMHQNDMCFVENTFSEHQAPALKGATARVPIKTNKHKANPILSPLGAGGKRV